MRPQMSLGFNEIHRARSFNDYFPPNPNEASKRLELTKQLSGPAHQSVNHFCKFQKGESFSAATQLKLRNTGTGRVSHLTLWWVFITAALCEAAWEPQPSWISSIPAASPPSQLEFRLKSTEGSHLKSKGSLHTASAGSVTSALIHRDVSFETETHKREKGYRFLGWSRQEFAGINRTRHKQRNRPRL